MNNIEERSIGKDLIEAAKEIKAHKEGRLHPKVERVQSLHAATSVFKEQWPLNDLVPVHRCNEYCPARYNFPHYAEKRLPIDL